MNTLSDHASIIEEVVRNLFFLSPDRTDVRMAPKHVLVGLSGGADSVVLLHLLHRMRDQQALTISALHVHHGLNPAADQWQAFCMAYCQSLGIPCYSQRVQLPQQPDQGIEAVAREARYRALTQCMQTLSADAVLTAHHQQDQAETLLLQLCRGAGLKGLSAMPVWDAERKLLRPLLTIKQAQLLDYARAHGLSWIHDDSNDNLRYDRNFVRHAVLPVMQQRYPQVAATLARVSQHLAEAQSLLVSLAQIDQQRCQWRQEIDGASLYLPDLLMLGETRAKNLLRHWLSSMRLTPPASRPLHECWQQLQSIGSQQRFSLHLSPRSPAGTPAVLQCYAQRLYCHQIWPALPEQPVQWHGFQTQTWGAWQLQCDLVAGSGIALDRLGCTAEDVESAWHAAQPLKLPHDRKLMMHSRQGGERLQLHPRRPRRALKVCFQQRQLPPWQRDILPLLSLIEPHHSHQQSAMSETVTLLGVLPDLLDYRWQATDNALGLHFTLQPLYP